MSNSQSMKNILDQAKEKEKNYDWVKAATFYEQALRMVGKRDFLRKGEIHERIGYCFCRAAFQVESLEEFKQWMQQTIEAYEKTKGFYDKLAG